MKTPSFKKWSIGLGFLVGSILGGIAHAESSPGFLEDYQYQVSNLSSMQQAQRLMNTQVHDTRNKSICSNRAEVWSYIMEQQKDISVGKVFIHFTPLGTANENKAWSYHVAPYILVNGEEMVLDGAFDVFKQKPTPLKEWTKYFGKSEQCVVLDPVNNPKHLALEKNNLPNDQVTPLTYKRGGARQYPTDEGICYIRKVPSAYVYPIQVYGADLFLAGNTEYASFIRTKHDLRDTLDACRQALTLSFRLGQTCADYLGIKKP